MTTAFDRNLAESGLFAVSQRHGVVAAKGRSGSNITIWNLRRTMHKRVAAFRMQSRFACVWLGLVDTRSRVGWPTLLMKTVHGLVHVVSLALVQVVSCLHVRGRATRTAGLFLISYSGACTSLSVYVQQSVGQFVAACTLVNHSPRCYFFEFMTSHTGALCTAFCNPLVCNTHGMSVVELDINKGAVLPKMHWDHVEYSVMHVVEDGSYIVQDFRHGMHRVQVQRVTAAGCVQVLMDVCDPGIRSLGLPFVGGISNDLFNSCHMDTFMRPALCMSLPRCIWMQACAC